MLSAKRRSSVYGMHSVARDAAYSDGAGDVLAALEHARGQLSVYPESPPVLHDVATLQLMAAEQDVAIVDDAIRNLEAAASHGVKAWATGQVMITGRCLDTRGSSLGKHRRRARGIDSRRRGSSERE